MAENNTQLGYTQLTRIVAPSINEVDYATKMQGVFDNINENFKKIASLPFIQGVQGDSYKTVEKKIWNTGTDNKLNDSVKITKEGALLLNSIFGLTGAKKIIYDGNTFQIARSKIGNIINNVSPIDFFKGQNNIVEHNSLYFYAVIDDSDEEVERELGQYYYFIDGRLKEIGNSYNNKSLNDLTSFVDYSGFYRFVPNTYKENGEVDIAEHYEKVEMLPTIYYDSDKDDICWKFNGQSTGISAIGVPGSNGEDANLCIVKVDLSNISIDSALSGIVTGVFNFERANIDNPWSADTSTLKEGNCIICISIDSSEYIAYGEIHKNNSNSWVAYWNHDLVLDNVFTDEKINNYFWNIGKHSEQVNAPLFLAIPSTFDRNNGENKDNAHIFKTGSSASNLYLTNQTAWNNGIQKIPTRNGNESTFYLDNYDLKLTKIDRDPTTGAESENTSDNYTEISKGKINIKNNSNNNALEVSGNTILNGKLNISGSVASEGHLSGTHEYLKDHIIFKQNTADRHFHYIGVNGKDQSGMKFGGTDSQIVVCSKEVYFQGGFEGSGDSGVEEEHQKSNLYIKGNLTIAEQGDNTGKLSVANDTTINGTLSAKNTTISDTLSAKNTTINGTLDVSGNTTISGSLTVSDGKNTILGQDLTVKRNATINNNLTITNGNATINGTLTVNNGNIKTTKDVEAESVVASKYLVVNSGAKIYNGLETTGPVYISPRFAYSSGEPSNIWEKCTTKYDASYVYVPKLTYPVLWIDAGDNRVFSFPSNLYTSDSVVIVAVGSQNIKLLNATFNGDTTGTINNTELIRNHIYLVFLGNNKITINDDMTCRTPFQFKEIGSW